MEDGFMPAELWTDSFLEAMRHEGDPLADEAVATLFADRDAGAVNRMMHTLVLNDGIPSPDLPPVIRDYLARSSALPEIDPAKVARAEELFGVLGPEILTVLGFYGLPADYAAKKGVQVLYRTAQLTRRPVRRVFETTQMVVDVMAEGGLGPTGRGVRTAQKVRLMHAAVRHMLTHDPANPWDASLGVPINQEDLAGTLMTFSYMVLDGLARLGVELSDDDREAYLHCWQVIGRIMGVREDLIPAHFEEARELTKTIHRRQIAPSPEGTELTKALLEGYRGLLPSVLSGMPASLMHFFLDTDPFDARNVAELLGVPPADWSEYAARLTLKAEAWAARYGLENRMAHGALRWVSRPLIEGMLLVERGGRRAPFDIPAELRSRWELSAAA
jgi:hypothetical protein